MGKVPAFSVNLLNSTLCKSREFQLTLYISHIRSLLVFGSIIWNLEYILDMKLLENVQRRWTKRIYDLKNLIYFHRFKDIRRFSSLIKLYWIRSFSLLSKLYYIRSFSLLSKLYHIRSFSQLCVSSSFAFRFEGPLEQRVHRYCCTINKIKNTIHKIMPSTIHNSIVDIYIFI